MINNGIGWGRNYSLLSGFQHESYVILHSMLAYASVPMADIVCMLIPPVTCTGPAKSSTSFPSKYDRAPAALPGTACT